MEEKIKHFEDFNQESDLDSVNPEIDIEQKLYEHHRFVADPGQSPLRIDKFLVNRIENASRNKIQQAADAGNIIVNDKPVKSNYKLKPNDIISILRLFLRLMILFSYSLKFYKINFYITNR